MESMPIGKEATEYAARFGVKLTKERHGIFGNDWDAVAVPAEPRHYHVQPFRVPWSAEGWRMAVRGMAERMGTGYADFHGFHAGKRPA